jgi:hypothetical protein
MTAKLRSTTCGSTVNGVMTGGKGIDVASTCWARTLRSKKLGTEGIATEGKDGVFFKKSVSPSATTTNPTMKSPTKRMAEALALRLFVLSRDDNS